MESTWDKKKNKLFKLVIIGDSGVGKSSLLRRFINDEFNKYDYLVSIGVDFKISIIQVDGEPIKLQIWDTCGGERFMTVSRSYLRGAKGTFFVYDVTDMKSFTNITNWMSQLEGVEKSDYIFKLLVGNKVDLESKRVVTYKQAKSYADEKGIPMIETSAKIPFNVEQMFVLTAAGILNRIKDLDSVEDLDNDHQDAQSKSKERCICS